MSDTQNHESIVDQINAIKNNLATIPTVNSNNSLVAEQSIQNKSTDSLSDDQHIDTADSLSRYDKRKRRRLIELRDDELWHCTYYPCKKVYSMKSTASIQHHKKTCVIATATQSHMLYPYPQHLYKPPPTQSGIPQPAQSQQRFIPYQVPYCTTPQQFSNNPYRALSQIQHQIQIASTTQLPLAAYTMGHDPYVHYHV